MASDRAAAAFEEPAVGEHVAAVVSGRLGKAFSKRCDARSRGPGVTWHIGCLMTMHEFK